MIATWAAYAALMGCLVAAAACALDAACRLVALPGRWVWSGALVLTVALTALAPYRGTTPTSQAPDVFAPHALATQATGDAGSVERLITTFRHLRGAIAKPIVRVIAAAQHTVPASLEHALALLWLAVSTVTAVIFAAAYARMHRARRSWPRTELHGIRVRLAPASGPAVVGLATPEIVIPRWLLRCELDAQRLVLAHEQEHLRSRDPLLLALGCGLAVLIPWHPAVWWMMARLRLAVELDCDARVLRLGAATRSYGLLLIEMAGRGPALRLGVPALVDGSTHLQRRLVAMTSHRPQFAHAYGGALAVGAFMVLLVACDTPLPTAADVSNMDVASAEAAATRAQMIHHDSSLVFMIDGARASAEQAHALGPDQIARISVVKPGAGGLGGKIFITTRKAGDAAARMVPSVDDSAAAREIGLTRRASEPGSRGRPGLLVRPSTDSPKRFRGLFLIDGAAADPSALSTLDPATIEKIEVIKGPAATQRYTDPRAANGVISVTIRAHSPGR